ncbi:hypothetical protein G6F26_012905 [Rhizopus arrhizus]|nr:hypothetical protein G6F30_013363 [Rhizopus arrhizus]KAG1015933.1 hypothetical protein G6F26_012905 [Rhizopus arrhizus]KAG1320527.1 hypothetical protein G6F63_014213 [Rhizopus arrhizus]
MNSTNNNKCLSKDFSMDMDAYLMAIYKKQGYEVTMTAVMDFLMMWEDCNVGPTEVLYEIDGITCTREEYAVHTIKNISAMVSAEENGKGDIYEANWEDEDDLELLKNLEGLINSQHKQFVDTLHEFERIQELKEQLCDLLASNINHWAHFRFRRPNNTPESVTAYLAAKQIMLKAIIPDYRLYRALTLKIKQKDNWARIVGDSSGIAGICDHSSQ